MDKKNLSMSDISSISGNDTNDFIHGRLSKERSIEIIAIIEEIKQKIIPKLDSHSRKNIQLGINKILQSNNYKKIISELKQKRALTKKEKLALGLGNINKVKISNKDVMGNNKHMEYLYNELMDYCQNKVTEFNCSCEKSKRRNLSIDDCEQEYSREAINYDCVVHPFVYVLKRADRHGSELLYALEGVQDELEQMNEFNILELGCGPAICLWTVDYFNKLHNYNKIINYTGFDINPIWNSILIKLKEEAKNTQNINKVNIIEADITQKLNTRQKYNIIVLNYVISWFAENKQSGCIENIYANMINSIDKRKNSIIIVNDVNRDFKGIGEFTKIENMLKDSNIKYNIIKNDLYDKSTIFQKYFNYWGKNNTCTSAQLIITIGGENDN